MNTPHCPSQPRRTLRRLFCNNRFLFGSLIAWSVFLGACMTTQRTLIAPPQKVAGAEFVGSEECTTCHETLTGSFHDATHAKLIASTDNTKNIGCEACHGPASKHVESGGGAGTIVNPKSSPETCFQCHLDKRGEFSLPHSHPVLQGKISCNDCHSPHEGDAIMGGGTALQTANDTCAKCHTAQGHPFVFEHEALREGCVSCHNPHGSVNDKMLVARNANLCLQCHTAQPSVNGTVFIGGSAHSASRISQGACWSAGCHEAVHGSNVNAHLRY